ncbi:MAG: CAP domain-containing protein [Sphingomonadales bacterium]|nr:MAG: CAP domain-containing protein [Sphingomonadales bacterium]
MPLIPLLLGLAPPTQPALTREIVAEINFARTEPRRYAERLRVYRDLFQGKTVYYPGNSTGLMTQEGVSAVNEAIRFLEKQAPLEPIEASPLLARAAADHVWEQGPRGETGHYSKDGSNPRDRVQRRGGGNYVAEVITYGPPSAVEVVRQLIVDDAVPGRGHRKTLFAAEMRFAGIACGPHRIYRVMCVAEFGRTPDGRP